MTSKLIKTHGILLKKTLLANDDAFLEFFTSDFGKISVAVKKFTRSKKRNQEIDFFRLMELVILEGRNSKSLRGVTTLSIFHEFEKNFKINQKGFEWIEKLQKILPEDKTLNDVFQKTIKIWGNVEIENIDLFDAFFRIKMLNFFGLFDRFDVIQSDVFFDPHNFRFYKTKKLNTFKISNISRQILEFLRRANFDEFYDKKGKLPLKNMREVLNILTKIEEFHQ